MDASDRTPLRMLRNDAPDQGAEHAAGVLDRAGEGYRAGDPVVAGEDRGAEGRGPVGDPDDQRQADDPLGRKLGPWDDDAFPAIIRPLSKGWPKDRARLYAHFEAVLEDAKRADPESRKGWEIDWEWIEEEVTRSTYFVAEAIDGRFVGIIGCEVVRSAWGQTVHINTLYITPRARYRGSVLERLLAEVEKLAVGAGIHWVTGSFIYRKAAERLAKKVGYKTIGVNILREV